VAPFRAAAEGEGSALPNSTKPAASPADSLKARFESRSITNQKSPITNPLIQNPYGRLPLSFEANHGQTDARVRFPARGGGYTIFLTDDEAVLALRKSPPGQPGMNRFGNFGLPGRLDPFGPDEPRAARWPSRAADWKSLWPSLIPDLRHLVPEPNAGKGAVTAALESQPPQVMRMRLVGGSAKGRVVGLDELPGRSNYFIGNDPKKWRTNVPSYARVKYEGVYPGVDLVYYGNQRQLEYDLVVQPGADPTDIQLEVEADGARPGGADERSALWVDTKGELVIRLADGDVRFHKPIVYQTDPALGSFAGSSSLVEGHYTLTGSNEVRFAFGPHDHTRPLIIDPVLSYSTYLGGSGDDAGYGNAIALDSAGNAYLSGSTLSPNFPTKGSIAGGCVGGCGSASYHDIFVTKLSSTGSSLVYSAYLGGSLDNYGQGIAIDSDGDAYVTGWTASTDFPTTPGAFQQSFVCASGSSSCSYSTDAFVSKINSNGSALLYSTYLGGGFDSGLSIAVDSSGYAYLTGTTDSTSFPTTPGAFQSSCPGSGFCNDSPSFVTKMDTSGASLVYSTYVQGSSAERGEAIAIDSLGRAFATGITNSPDFPVTPTAFQSTYAGVTCTSITPPGPCFEAFLIELNETGTAALYSTYLGGSDGDWPLGLVLGRNDIVYIAGSTHSIDFPITSGALQSEQRGGTCGVAPNTYRCSNAFVAKFDPTLSGTASFLYSTYFGGSNGDMATGIAIDSAENIYVTGTTASDDFPTLNPIQLTLHGSSDQFVAEMNPSGSALLYSTYLGGSGREGSALISTKAIAVDAMGNAYIVGATASTDFPVTQMAFQTVYGGGPNDSFVAKIAPRGAPGVSLSTRGLFFGQQPFRTTSAQQAIILRNVGSAPLAITAITTSFSFAQTNTCERSVPGGRECIIIVTFTPEAFGPSRGTLTIEDDAVNAPNPQTVELFGTTSP
jgi:hypothetical protein